ncbi:hypothetical protein [Rhizobium aegyptiacum]|uniref:hypothetical protein n=1 Tax=Rhizobium aegyptiacum TaxID=1764550 RepID=UPI0007E57C3D|nr:hypothetical protein [Rhizobium aegyptiacum]
MANTSLNVHSEISPATPARVSVPVLGATLAVFASISFLLYMLLGFVAPEWGLHRPWLQAAAFAAPGPFARFGNKDQSQ